MDGPGEYYAKWNKSEEDKYSMLSLTCGILKVKQMNVLNKRKTSDLENQLAVSRKEGGWGYSSVVEHLTAERRGKGGGVWQG